MQPYRFQKNQNLRPSIDSTIRRKIFELSCLRGARAQARGENSRAPEMQLEQGWQTPYGMAKTVYERENCEGAIKTIIRTKSDLYN